MAEGRLNIIVWKSLVLAGIAKQDQLDGIGKATKELLTQILILCTDDKISPRINMQKSLIALKNDVFR